MIKRWDDLRFLLALARAGTLTAAATALGVSQPTVGRRISVLEKKVGTPLIERRPDGYLLSDAGQAVVAQAERIEAAVLAADQATAFDNRRMRERSSSPRSTGCAAACSPSASASGNSIPTLPSSSSQRPGGSTFLGERAIWRSGLRGSSIPASSSDAWRFPRSASMRRATI
jgi:DNA-binding transcriptional LysR family regulator